MSNRSPRVKKLYHYTSRKNLFGIAVGGLRPNKYAPPTDLLTMGQPVVWLTTQPSLTPSPADLDHMRHIHGVEGERFRDSMILERDTRLSVNLSMLTGKLVHWHSWMQTTSLMGVCADGRHITGRDVLETFPPGPAAKQHWWIFFGTIKPARIELQSTPETMLPGIEDTLTAAIERGDTDTIARLTELRDQINALRFGTPLTFDIQDEAEAAA
jgi:hypothetical protein